MDWGELNPDILSQIAKKVGDISNFIRLRSVCKWWRLAVHPSNLPPQLPFWIETKPMTRPIFDLQLHSLYSNNTRTMRIPEGKDCFKFAGSSTGYMLLRYNLNSPALLLNPMTGFQAAISFEGRTYCKDLYIGRTCSPNPNASPSENGIDVVFSMIDFRLNQPLDCRVCLWRYTEKRWTSIFEMPYDFSEIVSYYNGRLYCFSKSTGDTRIIDPSTRDVVSVIPHYSTNFNFLIEACGDLLGLHMLKLGDLKYQIEVYRLDDSGENSCWAKVNNGIGDRMLFLDFYKGFCLKASDFDGFRGNCIYFPTCTSLYNKRPGYVLVRYDIGDCKTQVLHFLEDFEGTWFVPSLRSHAP